ncbi:protein CONSERVED ONLY IN THE GREEN LINEAGE 160, chloroplastic [Phoenix dactylifera]|uniref:Protein CONSERVED ONLY IN THE GREEN LINEAGE 160, chloroplastic n=1 Tax=Phoenix dactylifera TaxID=42345 RepID=A0A8B8J5Y0_PHODC|nr:protein CONSERVED ONLY IN THE GREEN LINEAGE 160, chloroplastic [Phoenix dactylifera]XP_026661359.1 protein CONSERVED ONLY IN THE GREEN LINEAGE 160, chloroplastic [Phoenix dactylifera]
MAIVTAAAAAYRTSILSAAVPASEDLSPSVPSPRQTKVVLPKKKPLKWSTGVAPGEYGGPPTTTKLRKYWGGRGDEDPVTATDDFIWNKDFLGRMQRLLREDKATPNLPPPVKEQSSGFLSLNRAMSLDSVEIDLSKELRPPPTPVLEQQVEAARRGISAIESLNDASSPKWRFVPTRREQAKWDRASKAATGGSDVVLRESRRERGDPKILAAQATEQYLKLKQKLQLLTLGIGGIGVVSAYLSYSPETAASYGAGLLGSLVYIRLLGNSVDSMASGAKGMVKGAIGQPRLLVPVALVMIYNRWNGILVPDHGFMHLELIPMLVGFFTYKAATFVQAMQEAVNVDVVEKPQV